MTAKFLPGPSLGPAGRGGDPYPGLAVYDSFTDTNGVALTAHTPEKAPTGAVWTALAGEMDIQSNRTTWVSGAPCIQWIESGVADTVISCIVNTPAGANAGIAFRVEGASDWLLATINTNDTIYILKRNPGLVVVASDTYAINANTDYALELTLSGANIVFKIDGNTVITTSDSHNQTITKHGFHTDGSQDSKFDEFQITG